MGCKVISQIVLYTVNPRNSKAMEEIIANAKKILGQIPDTFVVVGPAIASSRAVASSNGKVVKITSWPDETARQAYMRHPLLRRWCKFVLKGWILEGGQQTDAEKEFIDIYYLAMKNGLGFATQKCPRRTLFGLARK